MNIIVNIQAICLRIVSIYTCGCMARMQSNCRCTIKYKSNCSSDWVTNDLCLCTKADFHWNFWPFCSYMKKRRTIVSSVWITVKTCHLKCREHMHITIARVCVPCHIQREILWIMSKQICFDGNDCVAGEYRHETVVAVVVVVVVVGLIFGFLVAKWQG